MLCKTSPVNSFFNTRARRPVPSHRLVREVMRLKFALIGGDRRSLLLASLLERDGHRVRTYAAELLELPEEIPRAESLRDAVCGAEYVILPVPAERAGSLNTPHSKHVITAEEMLAELRAGQSVIGGGLREDFRASAAEKGIFTADIMKDPDFVTANAAVTAECALALLVNSTERALFGSRVLVTGWGRLAKHLAFRLSACGAEVCVAARREGALAMAQSLGFESVNIRELDAVTGDFDFIVNTVPERVLTKAALCCCGSGSVIMELASAPDRKSVV